MSLQTQAILQGHSSAAELAVRFGQASDFTVMSYRTLTVTEHVLFELEGPDGELFCVEAFLNSWAADDYAAAFSGPSTLLTGACSPSVTSLLARLAAGGGRYREHDMAEWGPSVAPSR
jgi:hypothetical protein